MKTFLALLTATFLVLIVGSFVFAEDSNSISEITEPTVASTTEVVPVPETTQAETVTPESVPEETTDNSQTTEQLVAATTRQSKEPVQLMDALIVSAATIEQPLSEVISSITVITAEDIARKKVHTLTELLRSVGSLDIASNGGAGKLSSVFIRGAASERTLIMINGVTVNDPSSPARSTDISKITLDNVERIEIVRGGQSVVFGAGAMGGVINIITKKGAKEWQGALKVSGGSFQTIIGQLTAQGSLDKFGLAVSASLENSQGYSVADRSKETEEAASAPLPALDNDAYRNATVDLNLNYAFSDDLKVASENRYLTGDTELDGGGFRDDPNYLGRFTQTVNRIALDWDVLNGRWKQHIAVAMSQHDRVDEDLENSDNPGTWYLSEARSRTIQADWKNRFTLPFGNTLSIGGSYQQEQMMTHSRSEFMGYGATESHFDVRSAHYFDGYIEDYFKWQSFSLLAGLRYSQHDQFGGHTVYRITPAYTLEQSQTRFKASYGNAYNTPTLYQLYSESMFVTGNPDLKPEESTGWEIGIDQALLDNKLKAGITYFQTNYEKQITTDSSYTYINLDKVETKGWEVSVKSEPVRDLSVALHYTKLTANDFTNEDTIGKEPLLRRADYKIGIDVVYEFMGITVQADAVYVGPRWDMDFSTFSRKRLETYSLVNLAVGYQVIPTVEVFARVHNLLDAEYEDVIGYNTSRFNAMVGTTISLK